MWGFLAKIIASIFTDWLKELRKIEEAEAKGAAEAVLKQKEIDDARIADAVRARDAAGVAGVPDDPRDFRD